MQGECPFHSPGHEVPIESFIANHKALQAL